MRTRRSVFAAFVLVALSLVTAASAAPPRDAMVVGLLAEPVTMDPPQITDLNSTRVIKRMFEALGAAAAVQGVVDGVAQPLVAVYRASLAAKAARLVDEGRRRVAFLVEGEEVVLLREPQLREADPDLASFRDLDTPEEYAAALREAGWGA